MAIEFVGEIGIIMTWFSLRFLATRCLLYVSLDVYKCIDFLILG